MEWGYAWNIKNNILNVNFACWRPKKPTCLLLACNYWKKTVKILDLSSNISMKLFYEKRMYSYNILLSSLQLNTNNSRHIYFTDKETFYCFSVANFTRWQKPYIFLEPAPIRTLPTSCLQEKLLDVITENGFLLLRFSCLLFFFFFFNRLHLCFQTFQSRPVPSAVQFFRPRLWTRC